MELSQTTSESGSQVKAPEGKAPAGPPVHSLDFILDVPLKVSVELGRTRMAIREILQLAQGSVIELSKFAGEPLEILINDKLIARGEVVVVNEKFAVRLTDIISPMDRVEQLR
jgi:flagellar motor switch protein FliN/FliY